MENIISEGTNRLPRIAVDQEAGTLEIIGRSNPENSREFFDPLLKWLDQYVQSPAENTTVTVNLEHFNTSSSKFILDILKRIKRMGDENHAFKIIWMYEDDDIEMLETAEAYEAMVGVSFEKIGYPEPEH